MKKFLRGLTRKDITRYVLLLLQMIVGICIGRFWGGMLFGAASICLVFATVGKFLFTKTVARIDKQVKDHLVNQ